MKPAPPARRPGATATNATPANVTPGLIDHLKSTVTQPRNQSPTFPLRSRVGHPTE